MTLRNPLPNVSLLLFAIATTLNAACSDPTAAPCDGADCAPGAPTCGDGEISAALGEACDDHNTQDGDGCSSTCQFEPAAWRRLQPAASPPARAAAAIAYDAQRRISVLFGGTDTSGHHFNDTWEWDGITWNLRTPNDAPSARYTHAMAYDAKRQRVILFGGYGGVAEPFLGDTWQWDGTNWTPLTPLSAPAGRYGATMVFDEAREVVVLYGGTAADGIQDDMWQWDGATWTPLSPAQLPTSRYAAPAAYDAYRKRVVLVGGINGVPSDETWEWDGATWALRDPQTTPAAAQFRTVAFHAARQRIVVFGGYNGNGYWNDTWTWDGTSYVELPDGGDGRPPARYQASMVYDAARGGVLLFGGKEISVGNFGDTWELR